MSLLLSHLLPLAQSNSGGSGIGVILVALVVIVIALAIAVGIMWLIADALAAVPEQFRVMSPAAVYLMLIPLFNLVWVFFVTSRVPQSFKNVFEAAGKPQQGDYGKTVGLIWALAGPLGLIPFVNIISGIAGLVCMIMFIVKVRQMKPLVLQLGDPRPTGFPMAPGAASQPPKQW